MWKHRTGNVNVSGGKRGAADHRSNVDLLFPLVCFDFIPLPFLLLYTPLRGRLESGWMFGVLGQGCERFREQAIRGTDGGRPL